MSERSAIDFIEEYQTGAFIVIGTIVGAVAVLVATNQILGSLGGTLGLGVFVGGMIVTFVLLSYLLYGR